MIPTRSQSQRPTFRGKPMFTELMPLLRKRGLLLTISLVEGDTLRATVLPQKASEADDKAIDHPTRDHRHSRRTGSRSPTPVDRIRGSASPTTKHPGFCQGGYGCRRKGSPRGSAEEDHQAGDTNESLSARRTRKAGTRVRAVALCSVRSISAQTPPRKEVQHEDPSRRT